jgi:hypothetical protein
MVHNNDSLVNQSRDEMRKWNVYTLGLSNIWCYLLSAWFEYGVWYATVLVGVEIIVENNVFIELNKIQCSVLSIAVAAHCLVVATDLVIVFVHCAIPF